VFHHLNLQPALDLALARHDLLFDPRGGIGEAIDWVTPWNELAEIRFLSAATAFECLLARQANVGNLVSAAAFDVMRQPFLVLLGSAEVRRQLASVMGAPPDSPIVEAALSEFRAKVGNLNQRSLTTRLAELLARFNVPLDDLPVTTAELLRTRNRIVHGRAAAGPAGSTTEHASYIREALRRTILAMLGFEGQFYSYMNGPAWRTFRETPAASQNA
jgi:hypothetical protein